MDMGEGGRWSPRVRMTLSSETANRCFQGRENFAYAVAHRRIRTSGDLRAALVLDALMRTQDELASASAA